MKLNSPASNNRKDNNFEDWDKNGKCNDHKSVKASFHDAIINGNHMQNTGPKQVMLTLCKAVLIYSKWKQRLPCGMVT